MSVSLSSGIRSALSSIQGATGQAGLIQKRLATGKKVNGALENPASFFTSSGLKSRSSDLGRLLDGIDQGAKTIRAASQALTSLTKLVETAQAAVRQAQQNPSVNLTATSAVLVGGANKTAVVGDAGVLQVKAGNVTTSVTIAAGDKIQKVVDGLNAAGTGLKAEVDAESRLVIAALGGESLTIRNTSTNATSAWAGLTEGAVLRTDANRDTVREALTRQFTVLREQIDQLARDASYNGINLLNGDSLKVQFNENASSSLTIEGVTFDAAGLGIRAARDASPTDREIDASFDDLSVAIEKLRNQASTFGSKLSVVQNRQEFTKSFMATLEAGADQLVLADQNEESARLLTLNTRQQLSQTALSLASKADQGVLRLF